MDLTDAALQALLEKHRAETSLSRLEDQFELRERFISLLSHDLRIPLTAIKLSAQLIRRQPECEQSAALLEASDRIVRAVNRANAMVASLLDAHRVRSGGVLPLDLAESDLAQALLDAHAGLAPEHAELCGLDLGSDPVRGHWDLSAIRRCIENLVGNAIKYGERGGRVTVRLRSEDGHAQISVHNRGNELSLEEQSRLFRWYGQVSAPGQGSRSASGWGLGLMLVRATADGHAGSVEVTSEAGQGTTFTLQLPIRQTIG